MKHILACLATVAAASTFTLSHTAHAQEAPPAPPATPSDRERSALGTPNLNNYALNSAFGFDSLNRDLQNENRNAIGKLFSRATSDESDWDCLWRVQCWVERREERESWYRSFSATDLSMMNFYRQNTYMREIPLEGTDILDFGANLEAGKDFAWGAKASTDGGYFIFKMRADWFFGNPPPTPK